MANIDDKLTYLSETKNIFKNSLNSLGAEITSSTTFRNYLNWLDSFYDDVSDKTDLSVNGIVGRTSQNTAMLPSEYTQVDYIESSSTQYIDTGVNADNKLDIKYKVEKIGSGLTTGAIYNDNGSYTRYHIGINSNKYSFYILNNSTRTTIPDDTNVKHEFYIKATNRTVSVDGVTYELPEAIATDTGLNFWIFRRNSNATNLRNYSSFRLYSCSMYYDNELVRDFIPCYRNSDNEVGLYDLVNDVFYTNQGTGVFTYGSAVSIPNPDYPQSINNLTGNVAYKVNGKNILQINSTYTSKGITSTYDQNTGYITSAGTTIYSYPWISDIQVNISAGTTITLSSGSLSYVAYVRCYYDTSNYEQVSTTNDNTRTRTLEHDVNRLLVLLNAPADTEINETYYLQLEKGSEVTSFEPCISQTFNIPLGDIELCEIDTYEDKIYSSNGRFYLNKKTKKHLFTTDDAIAKGGSSTDGYARCGWGSSSEIVTSDFDKILVKCNKFLGMPQNNNTTSLTGEHWYCSLSNVDNYKIMFRCGGTEYTRDTFPEFIKNNEIIVYYPLKEPTTTEITQENYLSLYNALKQIQDYLTVYKINKEFVLGYSSPEIEY